jgi:hypothetical protein
MSGNANNRQVGGSHYKGRGLQHWDLVALFEWDYFQGQIIKYVMRWKEKAGLQDLEKGFHVYEKYIEIVKMRQRGDLTIEILREALKELGRIEDEKWEAALAAEAGVQTEDLDGLHPGWCIKAPGHSGRCEDEGGG